MYVQLTALVMAGQKGRVKMTWLSAAGSIASILGLLLAVIVLWIERKKL